MLGSAELIFTSHDVSRFHHSTQISVALLVITNMNAEIGKELIDNAEIAHTIIEQMGSQVDLLVKLATGVFGGLIALFIQILIHNSGD